MALTGRELALPYLNKKGVHIYQKIEKNFRLIRGWADKAVKAEDEQQSVTSSDHHS